MTRMNDETVLHRAAERVSAGAAAVALTLLSLMTVDAFADEAKPSVPTLAVSYSEVSLATSSGTTEVYRKLRAAARQVCGVDNGAREIAHVVAAKDCYETALAEAVRKIDRPALTALHKAGSHKLG